LAAFFKRAGVKVIKVQNSLTGWLKNNSTAKFAALLLTIIIIDKRYYQQKSFHSK